MKGKLRRFLPDLWFLGGMTCIVAGIAMVSAAAGLIAAGVALIVWSILSVLEVIARGEDQ